MARRMLTSTDRRGFTLVEIIVALLLLSVAVLGMGASSATLVRRAMEAEMESLAQQAVEDRLALVALEPTYSAIDSYIGTESAVPGLEGASRITAVEHVRADGTGGRMIDYREITVTVTGGPIRIPYSRSVTVGAP